MCLSACRSVCPADVLQPEAHSCLCLPSMFASPHQRLRVRKAAFSDYSHTSTCKVDPAVTKVCFTLIGYLYISVTFCKIYIYILWKKYIFQASWIFLMKPIMLLPWILHKAFSASLGPPSNLCRKHIRYSARTFTPSLVSSGLCPTLLFQIKQIKYKRSFFLFFYEVFLYK